MALGQYVERTQGMAAEGESLIHRVYHLDRGFEQLEAKLGACGAMVERISEPA